MPISRTHLRVIVAGVSAVALAALMFGWVVRTTATGGTVTLFVTGDTLGYLEPCGCRRDQAGGLPARMTLIKNNSVGDRLLVDVGNLTTGGRSYELLKLNFLLQGMNRIGYDAINLGRNEAGLDRDTLVRTIADSGAPFVSCNVLDRATGRPLAATSIVKPVGGINVGITGVTEIEDSAIGPGLRIRPAAEALTEELAALKPRCDYVVVLAWMGQDGLHNLADRFHEINCLLGGDVPQASDRAETLNRAVAFNVTNKGKVLGKLTFQAAAGSLQLVRSEALKVSDTIDPAPEMTGVLTDYRNALRDRSVDAPTEEGLEPIASAGSTADRYVGDVGCASCHPQAHQVAATSLHAVAFQTLVAKRSEYDPECLACHTAGYGARDGFVNAQRTPRLEGVQCENCHGRASDHIARVRAGSAATEHFRPVTQNTCVRCHDAENSENFKYAAYWPRIAHGKT